MRTGDLLPGEQSAVWFNGYQFGGPFPYYFPIEGVTHNELYQLDARFNWDTGHLLGWGGFLHRSADYIVFDNPPYPQKGYADYWYYNLELLQYLTARLYAVGRAGEILDPYYPVNPLRLSLGVGYRFNDYAILKTDFTYDQGTAGYGTFAHAFATELAFRF
jgi:hypothetical protein